MSKKTKVITSSIQPNPKEAEIWAKINEDGSREVKQYNSSAGKFECCGGSGSEDNEESNKENIVYLKVRLDGFNPGLKSILILHSFAILFENGNLWNACPTAYAMSQPDRWNEDYVLAVAINLDTEINDLELETDNIIKSTVKDSLISYGIFDIITDIPHLTKEEFYNFEL